MYCSSRSHLWPPATISPLVPPLTWRLCAAARSYEHRPFLDDHEFRSLLQSVTYVPVLRRSEGFEMMGVEALFSGTRPIVYETGIESKPYRWV